MGVAIGVALAGAASGCGEDRGERSPAPRRPAPVSLVDPVLRQVVEQAPPDARALVRYGSSAPYGLSAEDRRRGIGTVVLSPAAVRRAGTDRPAQDVEDVASDRVVLLRPAATTGGADQLDRRSVVLRTTDQTTTSDATFAAAEALRRPSGRRPSPTIPSVDQARTSVRTGRADGALTMRSSLRPPFGSRVRIVELPEGVPATVRFRIATLRGSAAGDRLRDWLTGPAGRRALRRAGFVAPPAGSRP